MILRADGVGVPQTAHSALAGRLADAWAIEDDLPAQDLRVAATIHDLGWAEWELAPVPNPQTGLPFAFHELPGPAHAAIWARGTDGAATFGRWVGLLVSLHCTRLMGWRQQAGSAGPEVDALVRRERDRQLGLRAGLDDDVVRRAGALIARWDGLSLGLCAGRTQDELGLDPWPLVHDRVELHVDGRELRAGGAWRTLDFALAR
jgi:hypothetical protein